MRQNDLEMVVLNGGVAGVLGFSAFLPKTGRKCCGRGLNRLHAQLAKEAAAATRKSPINQG